MVLSSDASEPETPVIHESSKGVTLSPDAGRPLTPSTTCSECSESLQSLQFDDDDDDCILPPGAFEIPDDCTDSSQVFPYMWALLVVFCGCTSQAPFEIMSSRDKGCAHLIVFAEHLFGTVISARALTVQRQLPWHMHFCQAGFDVGYAIFISVALSTSLPTSAVLVMKNANIAVTVLLEACILQRKHSPRQLFASLCITVGVIVISLSIHGHGISAGTAEAKACQGGLLTGLVTLTLALFCRAAGGEVQRFCCHKYGATVAEQLFFRSILGLPVLLFQWPLIFSHASSWTMEPEVGGLPGYSLWLLLVANIVFDYGTKVSITHLVEQTCSLTVTTVLTLQRFASFVFSAVVLNGNQAGLGVWLGVVVVLTGALSFTSAPSTTASVKRTKCD